jgi:hypothetical protein
VTLAAVARRLNQIPTALPQLVPARLVGQATLVQEESLPDRQQKTPAERRRNLVGFVALGYRRLRVEIGFEIAQVLVGQVREGGIGEDREIGGSIRRSAVAERPDEVFIGPAADAG